MTEEDMLEYMKAQAHRGYIAYSILNHELLMALKASAAHTPISMDEFRFMIIVAMAKAAGELA